MLRQISLAEDVAAVHPLTATNTSNSVRVSKSRLPSLSSLLGSAENNKDEKIGFRRLAKSLLLSDSRGQAASKGSEAAADEATNVVNLRAGGGGLDDDKESLRYYETAKNYSLSSSKLMNRKLRGDMRNNGSRQSQNQAGPGAQGQTVRSQQGGKDDSDDNLLARLMEANMKLRTETGQGSRNGMATRESEDEVYSHGHSQSFQAQQRTESRGSETKPHRKMGSSQGDSRTLKMNENIVNTSIQVDRKLAVATKEGGLDHVRESRVVMLSNIHQNTSLTSIMSQIYGGPLEKIRLLSKTTLQDVDSYDLGRSINWDDTVLYLYFQKDDDASKFMEFASTGMFIVNGYHLHPSWVDTSELPEESTAALELMGSSESARRVLVLKKPILAKSKAASHAAAEKKRPSYPDPILNYSDDFDVNAIKSDFIQFGAIVEILPVVSRKLCFAVQYFDVQSAVAAKHMIQSKTEQGAASMAAKYKDWYIWYGRDPTDKAALIV